MGAGDQRGNGQSVLLEPFAHRLVLEVARVDALENDGQAVRQAGPAACDELNLGQLVMFVTDAVPEPALEALRAGDSRRTAASGTLNLNVLPLD